MHLLDVVDRSAGDAEDVERVVASHLAEHEGAVFDGAGHGTAVINRGTAGDDAANGDQTDGWLEPDGPAPGRGTADAAAGVGSQRAVHEVRGKRCRGAGGRSAGHVIERPGVSRGTEVRDVSRASEGELVQIHLAHDDRAALLQAHHDVGIFGGHAIFEHRTCGGGARAGGVNVVFQANWNSMQRTAKLSGLLLGVEHRGLRERLLAHDGDVAVHLRVVDVDPVEQGLDELGRSHRARMNHLGDFGETQGGEPVTLRRNGGRIGHRRSDSRLGQAAANVSASKAVPIIPLNLRRVSLIIDSSFPKSYEETTPSEASRRSSGTDEELVSGMPGKPTSALRLLRLQKK